MVVASHDRYFLDRVCDDIFSIEADGSVRHHPGGWSAYWEARITPVRSNTRSGGGSQRSKSARTKLTYNDQRELKLLTKQIPTLERRRIALIADLGSNAGNLDRTAALGHELEQVISDLDHAETRWLELSELAEQLKSDE